jgi:hypothetical protein
MMFRTLHFSNFLYMSIQIVVILYINIVKIEWKIEFAAVTIVHFININNTLVVIFMIFFKKFVSSVLKNASYY